MGPTIPAGSVPDLECFICQNTFDCIKRKPYLLPCHHSACKVCLQEFITNKTDLECPLDGMVINNFTTKGGVRRHDDLLVALYVLEQQMAKGEMPNSSMSLQNWQVPQFDNDNSLEFDDGQYGGIFNLEDKGSELLEREESIPD